VSSRFRLDPLAPCLCVAALLCAPIARANGRFPTPQQIALSPTDPSFMAMMATFGVLVSSDNGATWDWICEQGVGYQSSENPTLGVTDNSVLIATFEGLGLSNDRGCTWALPIGGITDPVVDLVVEPSNTHSALIISSGYTGQDDAGSTYDTRVWLTQDDGATVAQVGQSLDQDIIPQTIDVAPSDPTRVYVSGTRRIAGVAYGVLLRSTDGAQTFSENDFPLISGDAGLIDRAPYVSKVDPTNPDRVYVRVDNVDGTRLLVSDDGLVTTRQVWQAPGVDISAFALSADGTKVYAGTSPIPGAAASGPTGLYITTSTALSFTTQTWAGQVQCLAVQSDRLLACSAEVSGFTVGASSDEGATWTALLHLNCVNGPLACPATSVVTTQCDPTWPTIQETLGGACTEEAGADGGLPVGDAGSDGGESHSGGPSKGGCSCSTPAAGGASLFGGASALLSLSGLARRRRRKR
jgi:MYXO-CTERM domain-containing protein